MRHQPILIVLLVLAAFAAAPAPALAGGYGDRLITEGNEFFKAGNFFRASESYRLAVLEEPADGLKKLAFGHSLFALGNYAYAAYSFRRGVRYLGYADDLKVDLVGIFPSRAAYDRAMRDVRRYASYYPSDPHALTVIAYAAFFAGDRTDAEATCRRLIQIDPSDAFAAFLLRRIEADGGPAYAQATAPPPPAPLNPPAVVAPRPPPASWTDTPDESSAARRAGSAAAPAPTRPPGVDPGVTLKPAPPPQGPAPRGTTVASARPVRERHAGEPVGPATGTSLDELSPAISR